MNGKTQREAFPSFRSNGKTQREAFPSFRLNGKTQREAFPSFTENAKELQDASNWYELNCGWQPAAFAHVEWKDVLE